MACMIYRIISHIVSEVSTLLFIKQYSAVAYDRIIYMKNYKRYLIV